MARRALRCVERKAESVAAAYFGDFARFCCDKTKNESGGRITAEGPSLERRNRGDKQAPETNQGPTSPRPMDFIPPGIGNDSWPTPLAGGKPALTLERFTTGEKDR